MAVNPIPARQRAEDTGTIFARQLRQYVGVTPYVYGGNSLITGTDCAGLVQLELNKLGISAPRTSEEQYEWAQRIGPGDLQPGDLVFMQFPGDNASPGHVEVYIGGGQVLGADDPAVGVAISPLSSVAGNIVGYGRVPGLSYSGERAGAGPQATVAPGAGISAGSAAKGTGGGLAGWAESVWLGLTAGMRDASDVIPGFGALSGASDIGQGLAALAAPFIRTADAIDWLFHPNHWLRIACGIGGGAAVIGGVAMLASQGRSVPVNVEGVGTTVSTPTAALPVGILVTGLGFLLLFIAFHNLPSTVSNWSQLLGYLDDEIHSEQAKTAGSNG